MQYSQGFFKGVGGLRLYYQSWHPVRNARAVLVLLHGLGSHSGRFKNIVQYLVPAGYTIYALDLRGHGHSAGQRGHINSWAEFRTDLDIFLKRIKRSSDLPCFVLGHSLGGMVTLDYALRFPTMIQGAITIAPALGLNGVSTRKILLGHVLSRILPRFTLKVGIGLEAISRDRNILNDCAQDPLVHSCGSARLGAELFRTIAWVKAQAADLQVPLLILQGGADSVAHPQGSREFFERLTLLDKERREYPGSRHAPHNDINYEELLIDLEHWLNRRTEQLSRSVALYSVQNIA